MKICLICGAQVDAVFPTCPSCGEASFVDCAPPSTKLAEILGAEPVSAFPNPESDTRPDAPTARKRRR